MSQLPNNLEFRHDPGPDLHSHAVAMGNFEDLLENRRETQHEMDKLFKSAVFGALTSKKALPVWFLLGAEVMAACGPKIPMTEIVPHPTGTAVPDIAPGIGASGMDVFFGQPAGTVSVIEPWCNPGPSMCMYVADGKDGGVVAMRPLFGPEFVDDGTNVTIEGYAPGGYQEILDPDRDGNPDGGRFNKSIISPAELAGFFKVPSGEQEALDEFVAVAKQNGNDVSIDMVMDADERVTVILTSFGIDGKPTVFTTMVQLSPLTVQELLGQGGDEPVVAHEIGVGGGVRFNPAIVRTKEPFDGAEVTVNSETGTIAVGEEIINTPATIEPPTATKPPELLPVDFTVANWQDFRTAILPYCYVNPDYSDSREGVEKAYKELQKTDFWKSIVEMFNNKEIYNAGPAVAGVPEGGGCSTIMVEDHSDNKITRGFFQNKLNPNEWIEVKFTEPTTMEGN